MAYDKDNKLKLLHDNPLEFPTNEESYKNDGLNFNIYSDVITQAIIDSPTPFTVGVYGQWGKGKTSFLNMIKTKVDDEIWNTDHTVVWFNAWQYEKEEHLIVPLIGTIINGLENKKDIFGKVYDGIIKSLKSIVTSIKIESSYEAPSFWGVKTSIKTGKASSKLSRKLLDESIYFNAFKDLEDFSKELKEEKKIIIFIDDLDRCFPPNAVKLLENIKLILSQKGFVFVLGIAKEVIEGYLKKRYTRDFGIRGGNHNKSYLEKIIQLSFTLPKFNSQVDTLIESLYTKTNRNDYEIEVLKQLANPIIENSHVSPRLLVRIINQSKIHSRIYEIIKEKKQEKEKIDNIFSYYMFVMFLQNLYEEAYSTLSKTIDFTLFLKGENKKEEDLPKSERDKEFEQKDETLTKEQEYLMKLFKDDTSFRNLLYSDIGQEWLQSPNIRKETSEFIDSEIDKSDDDKIQDEKEILKNLNKYLKKEIVENKNIEEYNKFIPVKNIDKPNDKNFEFSKFLVTNIWYKKINSNHKKRKGFDGEFQPVVDVSYNDAVKFCDDLTNHEDNKKDKYGKKWKYSLPTNQQFTYLASNKNSTEYPWGNDWDNKKCNNDDIGLEKTSIVGSFLSGDTKDGICDMSGNVWKWTSTNHKEDKKYKIIKGGSWRYSNDEDFSASCEYYIPVYRDGSVGFFLTRTK